MERLLTRLPSKGEATELLPHDGSDDGGRTRTVLPQMWGNKTSLSSKTRRVEPDGSHDARQPPMASTKGAFD